MQWRTSTGRGLGAMGAVAYVPASYRRRAAARNMALSSCQLFRAVPGAARPPSAWRLARGGPRTASVRAARIHAGAARRGPRAGQMQARARTPARARGPRTASARADRTDGEA